MKAKQFITDCEGPITLNDNAYELAKYFIPSGDHFFAQISLYDDILADIVKRPGYKAGDTLRLILPFLKVYGASNEAIEEYCSRNIVIVPGADSLLSYVSKEMSAFIISTSYEQYLKALCAFVKFDPMHVYCTRLDIDKYQISPDETQRLKDIQKEISSLPKLEFPAETECFDALPLSLKETVKRLDTFFWEEILFMKAGQMLHDVNPIGGPEKANAILSSLHVTGNDLQDVIYVGDSITDVQAFDLVKKGGGLTVSFNGNRYAIKEADIACISGHTVVLLILACLFSLKGKKAVMKLAGNWSVDSMIKQGIERVLVDELLQTHQDFFSIVKVIGDENRGKLVHESEAFRKTIRGKEVGSLG